MKPRTRILLIALLVAGWAVPAVRVARFCLEALQVYQGEQTLNAWNDVTYGAWLAGAYVICLAVPAVVLLIRRMTGFLGSILVGASWLIAADVIRIRPEEVIILFPSMNPLRPVRWTVITIFVVGVLYLLRSRRSQQGTAPNGGPADSLGNSGIGGGPPSVS